MRKNKLLLLLALLMTAATGAWATDVITVTWSSGDTYENNNSKDGVTLSGEIVEYDGEEWALAYGEGKGTFTTELGNFTKIEITGGYINGFSGEGWSSGRTWTGNAAAVPFGGYITDNSGKKPWTITFTIEPASSAPAGYTVSLKDGVKDADKWTISPNPAPEGSPVTIQYTGRLKVKGVKATSDEKPAAPSVTEVTTFSELQTALSAGKDVKLKNDIVCTAEIEITSKGALTIDGNGKKLSTTSEIRAFKVGSSATVAFKDLTLTGFVSGGGPAINNSGTIVLDGCTISNCHVNNSNGGGAIENKSTSGKLYAINTTFSGNYSGEIGGAINNYRGSLFMSGCTFTNNYTTKSNAYWGGAIGINGGDEVRLINCSFSGNQYGTNAGPSDIGVYSNPTNYTIAGCTGATIASNKGDITTIASGTATLDYSDLSNISFTVEQAKPAATVTTAPTGAAIVGRLNTNSTELVSGGVADGGTLWYAVTTTNTKPTSTEGFSDAVPTAKDIKASGTVYVWYYVKGDDTHSDSEIAATAIEVPVADIVWDVTNVSNLEVPGSYSSYEKEGVTLRSNGENIFAQWVDYGDPTRDGIAFEAYETGGFTFTAPTGKKFTKIDMKPQGPSDWNEANLGTGWVFNNSTVTWKGTAASTVKLLTGTDYFEGANVKCIVFYLSE